MKYLATPLHGIQLKNFVAAFTRKYFCISEQRSGVSKTTVIVQSQKNIWYEYVKKQKEM